MKRALVLLLTVFFLSSACAEEKKDSKIVTITEKTFPKEISKGVVLVDFWATWCAPCRRMSPVLESIANEKSATLKIGKIDVDDNKDLALRMNIDIIPAMILFKDGKEITRFLGTKTKEELEKGIEDALK